jgi:hypothetical protein
MLYWLKKCRDYSPLQPDCSNSLIELYISLGHIESAWDEMRSALKQKHVEREMLNFLDSIVCKLPYLALSLHLMKLRSSTLSTEEAQYLLLLVKINQFLIFLFIYW